LPHYDRMFLNEQESEIQISINKEIWEKKGNNHDATRLDFYRRYFMAFCPSRSQMSMFLMDNIQIDSNKSIR